MSVSVPFGGHCAPKDNGYEAVSDSGPGLFLKFQNFTSTKFYLHYCNYGFWVKKGFKVLVQFVLGEIFGFRLFFSLV